MLSNPKNIVNCGRMLNIAMLATQLLIFVAITTCFMSMIFFLIGFGMANMQGADISQFKNQIPEDLGQYMQEAVNDIMTKPGQSSNAIASAAYFTFAIKHYMPYYIAVSLIIVALLIFWAIRKVIVVKNPLYIPNPKKEAEASKFVILAQQTLKYKPIITGHHTAFSGKKLILSGADLFSIIKGKIAPIRYKIHHELCHKESWDVWLGSVIKTLTMFNCCVLAFILAFITRDLVPLLTGVNPNIFLYNLLLLFFIARVIYLSLFKIYYLFSILKEHIADEFAHAQVNSIDAANSAFNTQDTNRSKLHPPIAQRLDYLQTKQSNIPLKLFLMVNLVWLLSYTLTAGINVILFKQMPWAEELFMLLNLPLAMLVIYLRAPKANRWFCLISAGLLILLICIQGAGTYWARIHIMPHEAHSPIDQIIDKISFHYVWFVAVLFCAQYPREQQWQIN